MGGVAVLVRQAAAAGGGEVPPPAPGRGVGGAELDTGGQFGAGAWNKGGDGNGSHEMLRVTSQVSSDSFLSGARQLFIIQRATFVKAIHCRHYH